jgi:putative membrane protein
MGYFFDSVTALLFLCFAGLGLIAEEIEAPFGSDANDPPTGSTQENVRKSVRDIFLKFPA